MAHCWVSDTTVEVSGPVEALALIAAPPTPTFTPEPPPKSSPPADPTKLVISERVCNETEYTVILSWIDSANNEKGFRVYRGKELSATLEIDTVTYKDNPPGSGPYTYGVEAFNAAGTSERPTVDEEGCLY